MYALLESLLDGNAVHAREFGRRFDDVQDSQAPKAVTVSCSDSRVLQDHIWGNEQPGYIFTCTNIGNRVIQQATEGPMVSGDMLYPIAHTGTEMAIVVGHTGCGAITATYDEITDGLDEPAGIDYCIGLLREYLEPGVDALPEDVDRPGAINRLVEYNVDRQVEFLRDSDDIPDTVTVVGVVYDFQDIYSGRRGEIQVINIDGETDVDTLRREHATFSNRINRLWEY